MAKTPQSPIDDEDIVQLRDGVVGEYSGRPLTSVKRRSLALARLRALAFAMASDPDQSQASLVPEQFEDNELLAYLLDTIPDTDVRALERRFSSDPSVLSRLVDLYNALAPTSGLQNRKLVDHPALDVVRHTVVHLDVQGVGELLHFRPRELEHIGIPSRLRAQFSASMSDPKARSGGGFGLMRRSLRTADRLAEEVRSLLGQMWSTELPVDKEHRKHARLRDDRVAQLRVLRSLEDLRTVLTEMRDGLNDRNPVGKMAAARWQLQPSLEVAQSVDFSHMYGTPAYDVVTGPWRIQLRGSPYPDARLLIQLTRRSEAEARDLPDVTLVRPAQGFKVIALDKHGRGNCSLPRGRSWLLVQAEEIWQVQLFFQ